MIQDSKGEISLDGGSTWHDATIKCKLQATASNTQFDFNAYLKNSSQEICAAFQIEPSMITEMRQVASGAQQAVRYQEILSQMLNQFHQEYYGSFIDDTQK